MKWRELGDITMMPFKLDMSELLQRARRQLSKYVGEVTLNLPFISIGVCPKDIERKIARELVIRLKDRRVLSARECCDNCIDDALVSLQEIRELLVTKQVELSEIRNGPLQLVIEAMTASIRQFLTYEETLKTGHAASARETLGEFYRPPNVRQAYFEALEALRGHLSGCVGQIAVIAGMGFPSDGIMADYHDKWPTMAYVKLAPDVESAPRKSKSRAQRSKR